MAGKKGKKEEIVVVEEKPAILPPQSASEIIAKAPPASELLKAHSAPRVSSMVEVVRPFAGRPYGGLEWVTPNSEKNVDLGHSGVSVALVDFTPMLLARASKWKVGG